MNHWAALTEAESLIPRGVQGVVRSPLDEREAAMPEGNEPNTPKPNVRTRNRLPPEAKDIIAAIHARCIEEGDCLLWQGPTNQGGMPRVYGVEGRRSTARRALFKAFYGEIPEGRLITPICGQKSCLAKAHLKALTPKDSKAIAAANGAYKNPARVAKRTQTARARSHITEAVIERVKQAENAKAAHIETGVSLPYCYQIRRGLCRVSITPFSGLGALA